MKGPLHRYDGQTRAARRKTLSMLKSKICDRTERKKKNLSHIFDESRRYAIGQSMSSYGQVGSLLYRNSSARPYELFS